MSYTHAETHPCFGNIKGMIDDVCNELLLNVNSSEYKAFELLTNILQQIAKNEKIESKDRVLINLFPMIEALIIIYSYIFKDDAKRSAILVELEKARDNPAKQFTPPTLASLNNFVRHCGIPINYIIRKINIQNCLVIFEPFMVYFPRFIDFEHKRRYFY